MINKGFATVNFEQHTKYRILSLMIQNRRVAFLIFSAEEEAKMTSKKYTNTITWEKIMQSKNKHLIEYTIGIIVIIVTVALYHIVSFSLESEIVRDFIGDSITLWFMLSGIISAIVYAIITKDSYKSVIVGIITAILWFIWVVIYIAFTITFP